MLIVGLTGGIGSGKTTVANLFEKLGANIIDTDQLARHFTQPNQPALKKIIEKFGSEILYDDGSLNRKALRKIIFKDEDKRHWLENLLHPLIRSEIERQLKKPSSTYHIIVIPLLAETQPNPFINRVLVIDSDTEEQIKRIQERDHLSQEEAIAIINTQATRQQRLAIADDVIKNNGSIDNLMSQVSALHEFYTESRKTSF